MNDNEVAKACAKALGYTPVGIDITNHDAIAFRLLGWVLVAVGVGIAGD